MGQTTNQSPEIEEIINQFTLFHDTFMSKVFDGNIEATQYLLNIILGRTDLEVIDSHGQYTLTGIVYDGRNIRVDILAKDESGKLYNIEVQQKSDGANPKRARYHSAMLDVRLLKKKQEFKEISDSYVIFITRNDYYKKGLPIYHVKRTVDAIDEDFNDGSHIIYVNGSYKGDDPIGRLVHDFNCEKSEDMNDGPLKERVHYFKDTKEGRSDMCELMEDLMEKVEHKKANDIALNLISAGKMSYLEIAEATGMTEEAIKELAEGVPA